MTITNYYMISGILSCFQIFLLPGLFLFWLKETSFAEKFCAAILGSFFVNYLVVFFGTLSGLIISGPVLIFASILCNIAGLMWLKHSENDVQMKNDRTLNISIVYLLATILFLAAYFVIGRHQFGKVFTVGDPLVSWNRWAFGWGHHDVFPKDTLGYPQLVPLLWSITYIFTGVMDLEFFSYGVNHLLILAFLPVIFLVPKQKYPYAPLWMIGFFITVIFAKFHLYVVTGWTEPWLGLMYLAALFASLRLKENQKPDRAVLIILAITGLLAPLIKITGLILTLGNGFVLWRYWRPNLKPVVYYAAYSIALLLTWYGICGFLLLHHTEGEAISTLVANQSLHEHRDYFQRFLHGCALIYKEAQGIVLITAFVLVVLRMVWTKKISGHVLVTQIKQSPFYIRVFIIVFLGNFLLWAVTASYDIRNIIPGIFLLLGLFSAGLSWPLEKLLGSLNSLLQKYFSISKIRLATIVSFIAVTGIIFIANNPRLSIEALQARQNHIKETVGFSRELNSQIITLIQNNKKDPNETTSLLATSGMFSYHPGNGKLFETIPTQINTTDFPDNVMAWQHLHPTGVMFLEPSLVQKNIDFINSKFIREHYKAVPISPPYTLYLPYR